MSLDARLQLLHERLDEAERSFGAPLAGFESEVERLCRDLLAMPRDSAQRYLMPIEALVERLERLQASFVLPAESTPRTDSRQASKAYRQLSKPLLPGEGTP